MPLRRSRQRGPRLPLAALPGQSFLSQFEVSFRLDRRTIGPRQPARP